MILKPTGYIDHLVKAFVSNLGKFNKKDNIKEVLHSF